MMIKYQQRWYSKAFAMFLALTILIAAPFSTVQAYAMEGAQLTESVNPGDTSPPIQFRRWTVVFRKRHPPLKQARQ